MHLSQSHFMQALGWATLNSFWQMGFLWCLFLGVNHVCKLSASAKYRAAVSALIMGFAWFLSSAVWYYQNGSSTYSFFENTITHSNNVLNVCLLAASVTYLLLLVFPAVRLFRNWRFVQVIKKEGWQKADLSYRLFVDKVTWHLGIQKKVKLVVSNLVSSPVTVGYLKPMILLPVAAMNGLSASQVEAILLHELSHIRRYDYLVNLVVSVIHTLLYFNPFAKLFMSVIESERETCCDELVLQFGYDKVGYASALLQLEKLSGRQRLALAAAGKQNLLTRIEKIVGMEKKKPFRLVQIVPLAAAMICILLFNSVLIIQDAKTGSAMSYTANTVFTPWQLETGHAAKKIAPSILKPAAQQLQNDLAAAPQLKIDIVTAQENDAAEERPAPLEHVAQNLLPVNFDDVDGSLTKEEKETVKTTVEATKKVLSTLQWKEIDASLADAMSQKEKALVKQEYLNEVNQLNWQNVEQNLKANYDNLNWQAIQENVTSAMAQARLDSLQSVYGQALSELSKAEKEVVVKAKIKSTPLPDCSVNDLNVAKETLRKSLDSLKALKTKKVVHL